MSRKNDAHKDDLEGVAQRLRSERAEADPLMLDRVKTTVMSRANAASSRGRVGARRLAVAGLTVGLMAAGTGGVLATTSGGHAGDAAIAQYGNTCVAGNGNGNGGNGGNANGGNGGNGGSANAAWSGGGGGSTGGIGGEGGSGGQGGIGGSGGAGGSNNGDFNCDENSFNTTNITEITTITENTTNNTTNTNSGGTTVNNYYTTVSATTSGKSSVDASKTTKTSGRHIKIHVKVPHGLTLRKVTVRVNGKSLKTLTGKKASANVELVNLPCSTSATTVEITVTLSNGKTVTSSHQYHLCA